MRPRPLANRRSPPPSQQQQQQGRGVEAGQALDPGYRDLVEPFDHRCRHRQQDELAMAEDPVCDNVRVPIMPAGSPASRSKVGQRGRENQRTEEEEEEEEEEREPG